MFSFETTKGEEDTEAGDGEPQNNPPGQQGP